MAKRLVDLYVVGKTVSIEDPTGGPPIVVYVKKLQSFELETAMSRANQERAKVLTIIKLPKGHPDLLEIQQDVEDNFTHDDLITFVSAEDRGKAMKSAESEMAHKEEWTDDDYLVGLQESWESLERDYFLEENPDKHEEAVRVFNELKRFKDQVEERYAKEDARLTREYGEKSDSEILEMAVKTMIEMKGDMRWLKEFKFCQVWLATRMGPDLPKRNERYFESREEVEMLDPIVWEILRDAYDEISIGPEEGKG